jgi:hypothetical protein
MDGLISEGVRSIALQGTGWLIACFLAGGMVWMFRQLQTAQSGLVTLQKECAGLVNDLNEKRLVETKGNLGALHEVAKAQLVLADSINARTETLKTIAELVTRVERDMTMSFEHWQPRVKGLEEGLGEAISLLRQVERRGG